MLVQEITYNFYFGLFPSENAIFNIMRYYWSFFEWQALLIDKHNAHRVNKHCCVNKSDMHHCICTPIFFAKNFIFIESNLRGKWALLPKSWIQKRSSMRIIPYKCSNIDIFTWPILQRNFIFVFPICTKIYFFQRELQSQRDLFFRDCIMPRDQIRQTKIYFWQ